MIQWLRRSFIAGFFVTVPLVISVATLVWIFRVIDGSLGPTYSKWLGRDVPGLGIATTALLVLVVGTVATNVIGKRILQQTESYLLRVPVFRTIYAPVKQLVVAFSPDNEYGFKRVVLVEEPGRGNGGPDCRLYPNQPPLSGGRRHLPARAGVLPGYHGRAGDPHLPHRRHGYLPARARAPWLRPGRGVPRLTSLENCRD